MNKKVLVIAVALMAVAMLATPVMATAPEKIQVFLFGGNAVLSPPEVWVSGNVQHGRGATMTYTYPDNSFWIGMATEPVTWLRGSGLFTADYNVNIESGQGVLHYEVVLTFPTGTFEGDINCHGEFIVIGPYAPHYNGFRHGVLQGTGAFQGWKLEISGETIDGVYTPEIYMFVP